jgi:hypothetical protein
MRERKGDQLARVGAEAWSKPEAGLKEWVRHRRGRNLGLGLRFYGGTLMPEKMVMGGSGSPKEELGIGLGGKAVQQRYRPRWLWPAIRTMLETGVCRRCNNALLFKLFIDVNNKR